MRHSASICDERRSFNDTSIKIQKAFHEIQFTYKMSAILSSVNVSISMCILPSFGNTKAKTRTIPITVAMVKSTHVPTHRKVAKLWNQAGVCVFYKWAIKPIRNNVYFAIYLAKLLPHAEMLYIGIPTIVSGYLDLHNHLFILVIY